MAERILLALDHSGFSRAAGQIAVQLAAAQPAAEVTALHVVNVREKSGNILRDLAGWFGFEPAVVRGEVADAHAKDATELVESWCQAAQAQGVTARARVETGKVAATLEKVAEGHDLVVMGLRGDTEERFQGQGGSMAGSLAEKVGTPILFATPSSHPVRSVAVGYDGSDAAKHALAAARRFILPLGVPIHLLFVGEAEDAAPLFAEAREQLGDCVVHEHVIARAPHPEQQLVDGAREAGVQLLLLGFRGRSAVKDFLVGSWTDRILASGDLAVLVAH